MSERGILRFKPDLRPERREHKMARTRRSSPTIPPAYVIPSAHVSCHHQSAMDLRTGPSAVERRTRARSFRRTILARPPSSCPHDHDRLRIPPASPSRTSGAENKESTVHRLSRACRPYATPSSISSFDHDLSEARTGRPDLTELQLLLLGFSYLAGVIFAIRPSNGLNVCLAKSV